MAIAPHFMFFHLPILHWLVLTRLPACKKILVDIYRMKKRRNYKDYTMRVFEFCNRIQKYETIL